MIAGALAEAGVQLTVGTLKLTSDILIGTNASALNPRESDPDGARTADDAIAGTLPWFSRYGDENNTVTKTETQKDGSVKITETNYPAPNLLPGFGNDPIMGINHETCGGFVCKYFGSDRAPLFVGMHQILPGADSDSAFHDAGKYHPDPITTGATIPPYFLFNKIGAVGTFFDVPNWRRNFVDPKTNIFVKPHSVITYQPSSQPNITQTNSNQQNR